MKKRLLLLIGVIVVAVCAIFACACLAPSTSASALTITLDDHGSVNNNIIPNYNLVPEKIYNYFSNGMTGVNVCGFYNNDANIEHYVADEGNGIYTYTELPLISFSSAWKGLNYYFDVLPRGTYTLTIRVRHDIILTNGLRFYNGSNWNTIYNSFGNIGIPSSDSLDAEGFHIRSFTFTIDNDYRCFYYLWGTTSGSFVLGDFKLEHGSQFTGFVSQNINVPNHDYLNYFGFGNSSFADFTSSVYVDGYTSGSSYTEGDFTINASNMSFNSVSGLVSSVNSSSSISIHVSNLNTNYSYSFSCVVGDLPSNCYPILSIHGYRLQLTTGYNYLKIGQFADSSRTFTITFNGSFSSAQFSLRNFYLNYGNLSVFPIDNSESGSSYSYGYDYGYDLGYDKGSDDGYVTGYEYGKNDGFEIGFEDGKIEGDSEGYSRGLETARNGNWWNVLTALVNVPVKAIIGFFDIEILGFNVLNLFRTIILISLFIFVVNLLLKKLV